MEAYQIGRLHRRMLDKVKKKAKAFVKKVVTKKEEGVRPNDLNIIDNTPPPPRPIRPPPPPPLSYFENPPSKRLVSKVKKKVKAAVKKVTGTVTKQIQPQDPNYHPPAQNDQDWNAGNAGNQGYHGRRAERSITSFDEQEKREVQRRLVKKIKTALKKATKSKVKPQPQRRLASMVLATWPKGRDRRTDDEMQRRLVKQVKNVVKTVGKKVTGGDKKDKQVKPQGGGHRPVDRQELEWLQNNT